MLPLAAEQRIPPHGEVGVLLRKRQHIGDDIVGRIPLLSSVQVILRSTNLNPGQNLSRHRRVQNRLEERRLQRRGELVINGLRIRHEAGPLLQHGIRLPVVDDRVDVRLDELELAPASIHAVPLHDVRDLGRIRRRKLARCPQPRPLGGAVDVPALGIVRQVEEVADGQLEGLHVTDVDDPDAISTPGVRHVHLLGRLAQLDGVDPLVVANVTDVVEVVVHAGTTGPTALCLCRKPSHVAPVIISP